MSFPAISGSPKREESKGLHNHCRLRVPGRDRKRLTIYSWRQKHTCGGGGGGGGDDLEGRGENGGGAHAGGGDGHGGGGGGGWSGGGASHGWFQCSVNLDRLSWNAAAYQEVRALGAAWTCPLVAQACLVEA